jgi:beta-xylosidase
MKSANQNLLAFFKLALVAAVSASPRPARVTNTATYRNPIIEANGGADPTVIRYKGKYYLYPTLDGQGYEVFASDDLVHWEPKHHLMYSGSGADGPDYGIGYATAKSPLGPFQKYAGNPIAHRGNGVLGPGPHCVIEGPHGGLWMVYHQKFSDKIRWDRFLAIDPLWFDGAGVIHVKTTRGTDEPAP